MKKQKKEPTKRNKVTTLSTKRVQSSIVGPEPLVPHVEHSKNGSVTILRVPVGTPKAIADKARALASHMAEQERKHPTVRYDYKKVKGQISLF